MVTTAVGPLRVIVTRRSILLTLALEARASRKVELVLFLAVECPISNRYAPELERITKEYAGRGVDCTAYFAEAGLSEERLARWVREFQVSFPVRIDRRLREVKRAGATMTPEAAVYVEGRLVYRGRIDDRYVSWGKARAEAQRRDVREVLEAVLAGKTPALRVTKSWGCFIEGAG